MIKIHFHSVMDTAVLIGECNETGYLEEGEAYELYHFTDDDGNVQELLVDPATGEGWILND